MASVHPPPAEETGFFDIPACPSNIHEPPPPKPPFRFLDLPAEIQNDIVARFIISNEPIVVHLPRFNRKPAPPPALKTHPKFDKPVTITPPRSRSPSTERDREFGHSRLALMLACKKLYRDHWRTYYNDNTFVFNMDVFREFARDIPSRCWKNICKIAFIMPHRHHHEGVWKMLTTMSSLNTIQLWMPDFVELDETVREVTVQGIKDCEHLRSIQIKRLGDRDGEFLDLSDNDQEFQSHVANLLASRSSGDGKKKNPHPPKLNRKLSDPFTAKAPDETWYVISQPT